jgi:hypothetical protein
MTKGTRIFLLGSAGILVLGLGTGVLASYMGIQNVVTIGTIGPDELAYIPQDTRILAYANVREVLDSELRAKVMALRPDGSEPGDLDPDLQDTPGSANGFFEATGLDFERDVDSIVASLTGNSDTNNPPLLIARGRFNTGLIETAILQHAPDQAKVETYRGSRMVVGREADGDAFAVAFAESGVLVLGSEAAVKLALDAKASGTNVTDNAEVMNLVRDSDDGNAWAVARFDALTGRAKLPQEIASQLPAITWFAVKGHINGGLRATLRAETRDDAAAQNLREVIRGFMALARLQAGQQTQFSDLLNSLELGGTGKTVSLGFAVDSAVIDALGALRPPAGFAPPVPGMPSGPLLPSMPSEPPPPVL